MELFNVAQPFLTVEDFRRRAGNKLARLIHRLAGKYPQLSKGCGRGSMLLALSVAWSMTGIAKTGNIAAFEHIDEALSPIECYGCVKAPPGGCITVEGQPYFIAESDSSTLHFLWDGFAIFIDHQGIEVVSQAFFDFADTRQSKAYSVMSEDNREELKSTIINKLPKLKELDETTEPSKLDKATKPIQLDETTGKTSKPTIPITQKIPTELASKPSTLTKKTNEQQNETIGNNPSKSALTQLTEAAIRIGDMQDVKSLELLLGTIENNEEAERCRKMLTQWRMEQNHQAECPNEYHFDGNVGQFIAKGNGSMGQYIAQGDGIIHKKEEYKS